MGWFNRVALVLLFVLISACGKDEKRDQEIQKAIQEGVQRERKFYEGMQKGVENLEKSVQEQQEKKEEAKN
ncbi:MAG: hypothetical protein GTN65_06030 [Armatimonadetes bacterium]|nr:hypothetical protein [Armatimonadota bacterium]NIO96649.1 hypothetical protein [Armatimonadota bacterium]